MEKDQYKMEYGKAPETLGPAPTAEQQAADPPKKRPQ